ncbi:MAG: hypothetical protein ACREK1_12000, partial [Longimicrobiales bacterium]
MRRFLTFALLFVCTTAVQAQEPAAREAVEPLEPAATQAEAPPTATAATKPAPTETAATVSAPVRAPDAPVPVVDMNPRSSTASAVNAATLRAPVDVDETAQDITAPRNFWWLVGAIVLAGIILAVLL